ncbi:AI-2E family transporter [Sanguibacter sp. HDW7]|uniref:AI-2E family transporter n=1 Tax=Sanguibacter sp. HDW7 TaxID=2714931 RepID=UPI0014076D61|nr:AI-2E family transporter [Sanguibacter sp. HDW7]QIK82457.1 AI-2E family transporter [Sanguibacter sp. HDW7]
MPLHPFLPSWVVLLGAWSGRLLLGAAAMSIAIWLGSRITLVLVALFLGIILTAVLRPVAVALRKHVPPAVATVLALLVGLLAVLALLTLTLIGLTGDWNGIADGAEDGLSAVLDLFARLGLPTENLADGTENLGDVVIGWVTSQAGVIASSALSIAGALAKVGMTIALGVFAAVCFLTSGEQMWTWFLAQLPQGSRHAWRTAGDIAWSRFKGYTLGSVLAAVIVGSLAYVVLLVLGVPFALPLAALVFVGTFVPLIGAPAAMLVAALVALSANGLWNGVAVCIAIALVGQVEGNLVQPLVLGKHVSLHPLVVGAGVSAGTLLAGLLGAVVAVPLMSVTWAVFSALRTPPVPDGSPGADAPSARPPDDDSVTTPDDRPGDSGSGPAAAGSTPDSPRTSTPSPASRSTT